MPRTRRQIQLLTSTSSSSRWVAFATYFGLAATLVAAVLSFVSALQDGSLLSATAWGALLVASAGWFLKSLLQHIYVPLPRAERFQPFVEPDELNAWPRDYDVARVRAALDPASRSKLPIVVGPSGAGKTTILRNLLPEALGRESIASHYIGDYTTFLESFPALLARLVAESTGSPYRAVVILDQFEQELAKLRLLSPQDRDLLARDLTDLIRTAMLSGISVIISVRFEWFYDLRVLGDLVPPPSECIHVEGPRPADRDDQTLARIISELRGILQDGELTDEIIRELGERGSLLLLETQVVGSTLESLRLDGIRLSLNYLVEKVGGVNGAIDMYFDDILAAAPNRRVALKVLAALSTATRFRRQEDIADIYDVVFEDDQSVKQAIDYLKERRLVITRGSGTNLELSHDFVAEYFQTRGGNELEPTDRDNVVFHLEAGVGHMGKAVLGRQAREKQKAVLGWGVFGFLLATMLLRLLGFGVDWVRAGSIDASYTTDHIFDAVYVPIFVAHGAWAIYITLFYVRILSMLNERPFPRVLTHMVPVLMAACVVIAYFIPYLWMASIGFGGMVLAAKLIQLSHNSDLSAIARDRVGEFGRTTMVGLLLLTLLGVAGAWLSFTFQSYPHFQENWIAVSLFASLTMAIPCVMLVPYHVEDAAVSEYLGLLARSPRGIVRRSAS